MNSIRISVFIFTIQLFTPLLAQNFVAGGSASFTGNQYQLTTGGRSQTGWIVSSQMIDLENDIDIEITLGFGNKTDVGEGVAIYFHRDARGAQATALQQGLMGLEGVSPSAGFELDTHTQSEYNDSEQNHADYLESGRMDHYTTSLVELGNIEDGKPHTLHIEWRRCTEEITLSIDGRKIIWGKRNLVDFLGGNLVYLVVSASGNGQFSTTEPVITFSRQSYPEVNLGEDIAYTGELVTLDAGRFRKYEWYNGQPFRKLSISAIGEYWVKVTNDAGCTDIDTLIIYDPLNPPVKMPINTTPVVTTVDNDTPQADVVNNNTVAEEVAITPLAYRPDTVNAPLVDLQQVSIAQRIVLHHVFFDMGEAFLRPESFVELDRIVDFMQRNPIVEVEIGGHSTFDHPDPQLSQDRADAVRNYLIRKGVPANRVTAVGYANTQPLSTVLTEEEQQQNRRVEMRIMRL